MGILTDLQAESSGLSVLYVEDEEAIARQTAAFLKKFFSSVDIRSNGEQGLECYREKRHDIIITDIAMPIMDGLEMAKAIRSIDPNAEIIVMTGLGGQSLLLKALEIGVEQYILKPVDPSVFATTLLKVIRLIKLEKLTKSQHEKINYILDLQDNLVFLTDTETILQCNRSFLNFFGFKELIELHQEKFSFTSRLIAENGYLTAQSLKELMGNLKESGEQSCKVKLVDKTSGNERIFGIKMSSMPDEKNFYIVSLEDVTDSELRFNELEFKATHDPLAKILNRMKFESALAAEISRSKRFGDPLSLIRFDIDDLSKLNESFGLTTGDMVIIKIANAVEAQIRQYDIFARYGDDEFVILALYTELSSAHEIAEKLRNAIAAISFEGMGNVTCSFGVVEYINGESSDSFLQRASKLLSNAKSDGKNRVAADEESDKKARDALRARELSLLAAQFGLIKVKDEPITVYQFYKGLPVSSLVKIDEYTSRSNTLTMTIPKRKMAIFYHSKSCYIKHSLFPKTLYAEVKEIHPEINLVVLDAFTQLESAPVDRRLLRLEPAKTTPISFMYGDGSVAGKLIDMSMNSMSICAESVTGLMIGLDAKVLFHLSVDGVETEIGLDARVMRFYAEPECGSHKVILATFPNPESEKMLMSYFSARQLELMRETSSFNA